MPASFLYAVDDAAAFALMPEALRQNLGDALASALDKQILTRTGDGLLDFGSDLSTPKAATTVARYLALTDRGRSVNAVDRTAAHGVGQ